MSVRILATRGTEAQIQAVSSASQSEGQIAYATDTKEFYVSDGTQFNKITDLESNGNFYVDGKVAIGTTTPSANRDLTIKLSDDVNGGLEILRSNGIQKLHLTYSQISNAGSFQPFTFRGDYGANFTQNQNRSSGNIFQFNTNSGRRITDTDAEQAFLKISPDVGQSGTANYVGLLMDVTETSVGSGTNSLMDLRVGGSSKFTVRNDGKVGIGTTSPVGILHAYSTSAPVIESPSNAAMIIRRNDNTNYSSLLKYHSGNSEKFVAGLSDAGDFTGSTGEEYFIGTTKTNPLLVLKNDGKVGIGVTDPERILDVGNTMMVRHATNANRKLVIGWGSMYPLSDTDEFQFLNGGASQSGMRFYGRTHSSAASKGNLFSSTGLMIGKSLTDLPDANTHVTIGGADTDTILLKVRNYTNANIFSILGSGNVGIGTTSPTVSLQLLTPSTTTLRVDSTNSFGRGLKIETDGLNQNLTSDGGTFSIIGKYSTVWEMNTNVIIPEQYFYGGYVNFRKRSTTTNLAQIGLEDNSNTYFNTGNFGIGTTSPSEKLEVSGNAKVDKLIGNNANFDIYAQYTNRGRITLHSSSSGADSTIHTSFLTNGSTRMVINRGGNVGIGTTSPHSSALLEVASTTKGVLFPRMTGEQREAIEEPATGLIVYQTDATEGLYIYKSTGWTQII
jgi:hypothetical protein